MFEIIKRWYEGECKLVEYDNDPDSSVFVMPSFHTEYHWTAKIARVLVGFYQRNWQWIWSSVFAIAAIYVGILALK